MKLSHNQESLYLYIDIVYYSSHSCSQHVLCLNWFSQWIRSSYISVLLCGSQNQWIKLFDVYVNKCPTKCNYTRCILSVNCCMCFGWFLHPSSGAQITVSTESGTSQPLLLPVAIVDSNS